MISICSAFSEILRARLEQEKQILIREQDQDRSAYQKLLRDFHALEQRSDQMERELARFVIWPTFFIQCDNILVH